MNRLETLRKAKKLSQKDLAGIVGVGQSSISHWENGKYEIDNSSLIKLANYFDVSVDHLLGNDRLAPYVNEHGVTVIPADPAKVAEHEAWMLQEREENRENMRQALNAMAQQKSPTDLSKGYADKYYPKLLKADKATQDIIKALLDKEVPD